MKTEKNIDLENMQELNPEELEDVTGGGIREIVAATTLAAMTMTGNTVSAFGLANAMAEDAAHVEAAPEQTAFGAEFVGEMEEEIVAANVDEIVEEAEMNLTEDGETEQDEVETVEEVAEADLGELTGEADAPAIEDEDKRQLMADLIGMAVEDKRNEGVYAALNATFATLADNAEALANSETGVIETEGNAIIDMTYDALSANFNNSPEQLMGAIGAAAARAEAAGFIQTLGGDAALVSMAAAESGASADMMKYSKSAIDALVDAIALACPELKPLIPFLKALSGDVFSTGGGINAEVLKKLNDIEVEIRKSEESIKRNGYKYSTGADKAELISDRIGNIMGNVNLTDAQKLQNVADLTENSEFLALESAMNGATKCFTSNVNDIFERQSIFEAAYARTSESVMFSSEALTMSTPYIIRQFSVYLAAYGVMNQVYNAHEQVYGASSLTATRNKMAERLGGIDMSGDSMGGTVGAQLRAYFARDRYTFVNRGTANVPLKRGIIATHINKGTHYDAHYAIENWVKANPLSQAQVEALCSYAASRGECLFDYLFNDMHFVPVTSATIDVDRFFPENDPMQWLTVMGKGKTGGIKTKLTPEIVTPYNRIVGRWWKDTNWIMMLNGQQALQPYWNHSNYNHYMNCNLLSAVEVGTHKRNNESIFLDYNYANKWIGEFDMDLLIFQGR